MPTRAEIVAEARTWIDAPMHHRGRSRKGGVDCLGLVIGAGVGSGGMRDPDEANWRYRDYGRLPHPGRLVETLDHFLIRIDKADAGPADVLALSWGARDLPMHLAIVGEFQGRLTIIHAYPHVRPPRVIETTYAGDWVDRTCGAWRYPELR